MVPMKVELLHRLLTIALVLQAISAQFAHASDTASAISTAVDAQEHTSAPVSLVDKFHQQLVLVMKSAAPFAQREEMMAPAISSAFDLTSISRLCLGRTTWKSLNTHERNDFIGLMGELLTATYASRFASFNDQRFEVLGTDSPRAGRQVVKTALIRRSGERVTLDYYLAKDRVFNVVADGVSDLSLRRADYSSVIKQSGYPALLTQIQASIADLRTQD